MPKQKLAIDVGGVLIAKKDRNGPDTNFALGLDHVPWIEGALDAVDILSSQYDLYILSFCGKKTEEETRLALRDRVQYYIPEDKWIFTRKREAKVDEMKRHNITTLIDDTEMIIDLVNQNGMQGILFKDWSTVITTIYESFMQKHNRILI